MNTFLIGIDDTDNKESRGTGFRARQLGKLIDEQQLGSVRSIVRHQLFFDPRIPYTSHNSSASLEVEKAEFIQLIQFCKEFMLRECAPGSDGGLCIQQFDKISTEVECWGARAKKEVLTQSEAKALAQNEGIYMEGLTGNHDGIIGALAAIGLRKRGSDGRCIWLNGIEIRDLEGIYSIEELKRLCPVDSIRDSQGNEAKNTDRIFTGDWVRPAVVENKIVIIVEKSSNDQNYEWSVAGKSFIKSFTD